MKIKILAFSFVFLFFGIAFAEYNSFAIPDSAEIRRTIVDSWISAPVSEVRNYKEDLINYCWSEIKSFADTTDKNDDFKSPDDV